MSLVEDSHDSEQKLVRVKVSEEEMRADEDEALRTRELSMLKLIVYEMQNEELGLNVRDRKQFLDRVPSCFTGQDVLDWLFHNFKLFDRLEAQHIAQRLLDAGYIFPLEYNPKIRDSPNELYRFQCPLFYPRSDDWKPSDFEYAVYLHKRRLRDKKKHTLEEYEDTAYHQLQQVLQKKWEFVIQQATESVRFSKERSSHEKKIFDSQERAFWWKHKPPPSDFIGKSHFRSSRGISDPKIEEDNLPMTSRKALEGEQLVIYLEDKVNTYKEESIALLERLPSLSEERQVNSLALWEEQVTPAMVKDWAVSFKNLMEDEVESQCFRCI